MLDIDKAGEMDTDLDFLMEFHPAELMENAMAALKERNMVVRMEKLMGIDKVMRMDCRLVGCLVFEEVGLME